MPLSVAWFSGIPSEWDEFVRGQPGWTHFHLFGWRRVIERVFGHECPYLAAYDDTGRLCGVLPLVQVKSWIFGHYLASMPFLNYGGPLGFRHAVQALVERADGLAARAGAELLELRSRHELPLTLRVSHRKITVVLDLPDDPAPLWSGLRAKVRSQVRRPRKEGVTVRFGLDEVEPFHQVFSRHMRDLGTPTLPRGWFEAVAETFPEEVLFGCAYLRERPIAAGCGLRWNGEFEMTWAAALREHNSLAPNMLLYWSFMERAIESGLSLFNFGRCSPGSGTHRFKGQWGSRDEMLWWYQRAWKKKAATPSPDQGAFALGTRLWRRLPLRVANALGPGIVRYIP